MTRVLASADHHFDQHSRFEECRRVHSWMVDVARREQVDLFVSGGDIYERGSTPTEREAVAEWLTEMAEVCPVVIAKGNHDRALDCAILARLRTRLPIIVEEQAAVHVVGGVAVATVAWPERARVLALMGDAAPASRDDATQEALRGVLRGLGQKLGAHQGPTMLLGHFMCDGAVTSTGQPLLGQPIRVGLTDLALAGADVTIMGHIHRAQRFEHDGRAFWYPGSPFRTDFGQTERKVALLVDYETADERGAGHDWPRVEEIETPATPMLHVYAEWCQVPDLSGERDIPPGLFTDGPIPDVTGAEVRLRYCVESDYREAAKAAAAEMRDEVIKLGAQSVKVEEQVVAATRARVPEIARARTTAEKLVALRTSKGEQLEPARVARLDEKLSQLEQEVRDAS